MTEARTAPNAAPARAAATRRRSVRLRRTLVALTLVAVCGAYAAVSALTPLPALQPEILGASTSQISADPADAVAVVDADADPTAIGWVGSDEIWSNSDEAVPIASLTKLITALVCLEEAPAADGGASPVYTVGPDHTAIYNHVLSRNGIALPAPDGIELTTKQVLELVLIPSANNYAIAYGNWVFGDEQKFVAAVKDWTERHGLDSVNITEASGLSPENVANPADLIRVMQLALEDPLIAEVVAEPWVDIPEIGQFENSNPLLGEAGVVGLKTGTLDLAGYNLSVAREETEGDRVLVALTVVLDRDDGIERANDARTALDGADDTTTTVEILAEGAPTGSVVTWTGREVGLVAEKGITETLIPGEHVDLTVQLGEVNESAKGTTVGAVRAEGPGGLEQSPVFTDGGIEEPDLWWRLTHPAIVFGWSEPSATETSSAR
ncbi:MAG: D-alanyl-D-alanine carboxypeptidase family protein [Leucobacter sp.]